MKRILAAHAVKPDYFAIAVGDPDADTPQTFVLTYNADHPLIKWGYVELSGLIRSLTSLTSKADGKPVYVALSDEGDVFRLEGKVPDEKIPGAGVHGEDASGFGALNVIGQSNEKLFAAGNGSQVYVDEGGTWNRICDNRNGFPDIIVHDLVLRDGQAFAVCGEFGKKSKVASKGALFLFASSKPMQVDANVESALRAGTRFADGVVAVGQNGVIVWASKPKTFKDVSLADIRDDFVSVIEHAGKLFVLSNSSIFILNRNFKLVETGKLPADIKGAKKIQVIDKTIIVFGQDTIAVLKDKKWSPVEIPKDLWNMK